MTTQELKALAAEMGESLQMTTVSQQSKLIVEVGKKDVLMNSWLQFKQRHVVSFIGRRFLGCCGHQNQRYI